MVEATFQDFLDLRGICYDVPTDIFLERRFDDEIQVHYSSTIELLAAKIDITEQHRRIGLRDYSRILDII